jgi:hypothetical protein
VPAGKFVRDRPKNSSSHWVAGSCRGRLSLDDAARPPAPRTGLVQYLATLNAGASFSRHAPRPRAYRARQVLVQIPDQTSLIRDRVPCGQLSVDKFSHMTDTAARQAVADIGGYSPHYGEFALTSDLTRREIRRQMNCPPRALSFQNGEPCRARPSIAVQRPRLRLRRQRVDGNSRRHPDRWDGRLVVALMPPRLIDAQHAGRIGAEGLIRHSRR